jgi:hypothetical protein
MKYSYWLLRCVAFLLVLVIAPALRASETIPGPDLPGNESGHSNHGIVFDSLDYVRLLGFDFNNQGKADQVLLTSQGDVLYSLDTPAGVPVYTAIVDWLLAPGTDYWLVATTSANGRFGFANFPISNSHISVTSGVFSGSTGQVNWANFRNLVTAQAEGPGSAIPEPATALSCGAGMLALLAFRRPRKQ